MVHIILIHINSVYQYIIQIRCRRGHGAAGAAACAGWGSPFFLQRMGQITTESPRFHGKNL